MWPKGGLQTVSGPTKLYDAEIAKIKVLPLVECRGCGTIRCCPVDIPSQPRRWTERIRQGHCVSGDPFDGSFAQESRPRRSSDSFSRPTVHQQTSSNDQFRRQEIERGVQVHGLAAEPTGELMEHEPGRDSVGRTIRAEHIGLRWTLQHPRIQYLPRHPLRRNGASLRDGEWRTDSRLTQAGGSRTSVSRMGPFSVCLTRDNVVGNISRVSAVSRRLARGGVSDDARKRSFHASCRNPLSGGRSETRRVYYSPS
jgi:hypothetical protein